MEEIEGLSSAFKQARAPDRMIINVHPESARVVKKN